MYQMLGSKVKMQAFLFYSHYAFVVKGEGCDRMLAFWYG